jgi:hypothetical protein
MLETIMLLAPPRVRFWCGESRGFFIGIIWQPQRHNINIWKNTDASSSNGVLKKELDLCHFYGIEMFLNATMTFPT